MNTGDTHNAGIAGLLRLQETAKTQPSTEFWGFIFCFELYRLDKSFHLWPCSEPLRNKSKGIWTKAMRHKHTDTH